MIMGVRILERIYIRRSRDLFCYCLISWRKIQQLLSIKIGSKKKKKTGLSLRKWSEILIFSRCLLWVPRVATGLKRPLQSAGHQSFVYGHLDEAMAASSVSPSVLRPAVDSRWTDEGVGEWLAWESWAEWDGGYSCCQRRRMQLTDTPALPSRQLLHKSFASSPNFTTRSLHRQWWSWICPPC